MAQGLKPDRALLCGTAQGIAGVGAIPPAYTQEQSRPVCRRFHRMAVWGHIDPRMRTRWPLGGPGPLIRRLVVASSRIMHKFQDAANFQ
jgi:hypothetical protein